MRRHRIIDLCEETTSLLKIWIPVCLEDIIIASLETRMNFVREAETDIAHFH